MIQRCFVFLLLATLAAHAPANYVHTKKSLAWRISFDPISPTYSKSDAHKYLNIQLSNITSQTIWAFESNPLNDYRISVTNASGKVVPLTSEGRRIQERQQDTFFRTGFFPMPPGWKYNSGIDLQELYNLPPGKYMLHVTFVSTNQDVAESRSGPRKPNAVDPSGSVRFEITP